jgi:hypothetical protein
VLRLAVHRAKGVLKLGDSPQTTEFGLHALADEEYVEFWPAGSRAKGSFSCTACGNTVTVREVLPRCGMCGARLWERTDWSPFAKRSS